jgi:beta-lactamase regulating signal transducer with metallopeptidase domain
MNLYQFGVQLIWAVGQVTVVLSLGLVLYLVSARRGPAMRSLFAAATLATALGMTFLVVSPWPRWHNVSLAPAQTESTEPATHSDESTGEASHQATTGDSNAAATATSDVPTAPANRRAAGFEDPTRAAMSAFWQSLNDNLATPADSRAPDQREWQWPAVLAVVFLAGIGVAIVRLLVGLIAVARYRRSAKSINDECLLNEIRELKASLGCRHSVTVCESSTIGTPATIGWRRPLVLLPADWREWNATDRRAVLAHELAHVARGDYLSGVIARLATALHFYHPLAHWLARRMRFEQELAADAHGVACSGGQESYVVALARMALAQDNRALGWAARPFLPSRTTFLRRIEMLRNSSRLEHAPYRPVTRRVAVVALAAIALFVAGLRGPILSSANEAEAQQPGGAANAAQKLDLKGVPEDTVAYAVIRPAAILAGDAKLRESFTQMEQAINLRENAGISPSEVEEFRLMAVDLTVPGEQIAIEPVMVVRTTKPEGWKSLADQWKDAVQAEYRGQKYSRTDRPDGGPSSGWSSFAADEHTLVFSPREQALKAYIDAMKVGGDAPRWAGEFARVAGLDAAVAVDMKFFAKLLDKEFPPDRGGANAAMAVAMAPLWRQTNTIVAGARVDGKLKAEAYAICKSEQAAEEMAATVTAARVLAQNMLPHARAQMGKAQSAEIGKFEIELLNQAEKFLAQVKPTIEGSIVSVKIEGAEAFGPMMAGLLLPAVAKARDAAQRAQSNNNLKQIALAMHNYADVHKSFPPAVLLGPDGKTKHSWRIAILPYLEQQQLYNQYNFNEPWDSETNKKILARMPAVFRHPSVPGIAGNRESSSYYVLTGKGGIFNEEPSKSGTNFAQIRDGTSNTLLVVEAKRDIPWTKPEDIPFDPDKELPKLGGFAREGFAAAIADGSVLFIASTIDPRILKAMFTTGGGEVIDREQLHAPARQLPPPRAPTPQEALRK